MDGQPSGQARWQRYMGLILLIVILVLVFGSAPTWGYSRNWGYGPSGGLGLLLVLLLILYLTNHLNF